LFVVGLSTVVVLNKSSKSLRAAYLSEALLASVDAAVVVELKEDWLSFLVGG
jgi:hypothetical protein